MQELQSEHNAASVEDGTWLREDIRVNVHHQVTSVGIFHDKTHVFLQQHANTHTLQLPLKNRLLLN
jgi:hypothetical protein